MSLYARIDAGQVAAYPFNGTDLRIANPGTSFPAQLSDATLAEWGVLPVTPTPAPAYQRTTQKRQELTPTLVNGVWTQQWSVVPLTAAEQAAAVETLMREVTEATQTRLDEFAQTRYYDGILSASTYANSTNPTFAAEGQYCVEARDATWAKLYEVMAEVEAGTRPMPSGYADIEPLLPVLAWP